MIICYKDSMIAMKKWLYCLNIDSLNSGNGGGSCTDTQITLETDNEWKFYLVKIPQRLKSKYCHIKKVNKSEIKDLLIVICFEHSH